MLLAALALMTQSVVEMRHHHRLLVIAAPAEADRQAQQQIAALAASQEPLAARDVVIVTVMADRVAGVRDSRRRCANFGRYRVIVSLSC